MEGFQGSDGATLNGGTFINAAGPGQGRKEDENDTSFRNAGLWVSRGQRIGCYCKTESHCVQVVNKTVSVDVILGVGEDGNLEPTK